MIKTQILLWKTIEDNRRLMVRVRLLLFYFELAPTYPWCNMFQTLLGWIKYEKVMLGEHPHIFFLIYEIAVQGLNNYYQEYQKLLNEKHRCKCLHISEIHSKKEVKISNVISARSHWEVFWKKIVLEISTKSKKII